jgi:hypothetical protein
VKGLFSILAFRRRILAAELDAFYEVVPKQMTYGQLAAPLKLDMSQVTMDEAIQKTKR